LKGPPPPAAEPLPRLYISSMHSSYKRHHTLAALISTHVA
jgi:hypothetical protein